MAIESVKEFVVSGDKVTINHVKQALVDGKLVRLEVTPEQWPFLGIALNQAVQMDTLKKDIQAKLDELEEKQKEFVDLYIAKGNVTERNNIIDGMVSEKTDVIHAVQSKLDAILALKSQSATATPDV